MAAEIVSYPLAERPPDYLAKTLAEHLYDLDRPSGEAAETMVIEAAASMLALGTADGLALRQQLSARRKRKKARRPRTMAEGRSRNGPP